MFVYEQKRVLNDIVSAALFKKLLPLAEVEHNPEATRTINDIKGKPENAQFRSNLDKLNEENQRLTQEYEGEGTNDRQALFRRLGI